MLAVPPAIIDLQVIKFEHDEDVVPLATAIENAAARAAAVDDVGITWGPIVEVAVNEEDAGEFIS